MLPHQEQSVLAPCAAIAETLAQGFENVRADWTHATRDAQLACRCSRLQPASKAALYFKIVKSLQDLLQVDNVHLIVPLCRK